MGILINIAITAITIIATTFGVVNYMPMDWLGFGTEPLTGNFGAITDLNSTDTMSDFPTLYNANNAQLMKMSTTSVNSITTLSNLVTVGALASGSLTTGFTAVPVALGGTGLTSPTQYLTMLGNGAFGLTVASSTGTSGQFLTSGGAGAYPSWQSATVTLSDDYAWTGLHTFNATTSVAGFQASSTAALPMKLNGVNYAFPSTQNASSTVLQTDGAGNLIWDYSDWQVLGETVTTGATTSMIVSGLSAKKDLKIVLSILGFDSASNPVVRFNQDDTSTYGLKGWIDGALTDVLNGTTGFRLINISTTSPQYFTIDVNNRLGTRKLLNWTGSANSATSVAPKLFEGVGVWNNTSAQITEVIVVAGVNFTTGSRLTVYGSRD